MAPLKLHLHLLVALPSPCHRPPISPSPPPHSHHHQLICKQDFTHIFNLYDCVWGIATEEHDSLPSVSEQGMNAESGAESTHRPPGDTNCLVLRRAFANQFSETLRVFFSAVKVILFLNRLASHSDNLRKKNFKKEHE